MKKIIVLVLIFCLPVVLKNPVFTWNCFAAESSSKAGSKAAQNEKIKKKIKTSKKMKKPEMNYVCPMHPEARSDKPGQCQECGMNLENKQQ
ncbi:MAG: hypothetical protein LHV68_06675 [Elusimicrobia bacterium]|nr:hypothetical protein [Candidatus Liberimonas magnetica]